MDKNEETAITAKIISYLTYVVAPVLLGNVVYWSHGVVTGKYISLKARIAILAGSLAIASGVHVVCLMWHIEKYEWLLIWFCSIFTKHLLDFIYVQCWDIFKEWLRQVFRQGLKKLK